MRSMGAAALRSKLEVPCDGEPVWPKRQGVRILKQGLADLAFFLFLTQRSLACLLYGVVAREERDIVERDDVVDDDRVDAGEDDRGNDRRGQHLR